MDIIVSPYYVEDDNKKITLLNERYIMNTIELLKIKPKDIPVDDISYEEVMSIIDDLIKEKDVSVRFKIYSRLIQVVLSRSDNPEYQEALITLNKIGSNPNDMTIV